ncbi:MAG: glycosyl transferase family 2 [marine bacterium B5-7]|nr:MAG: glycosyl transferase family 2 [marine bacterium B5-7]
MKIKISIIIPTLNEADHIEKQLGKLQVLRRSGHEVIVVDGGSIDDTVSLAAPLCDQILPSQRSRSIQMNSGAEVAKGNCLVFLHADTVLPNNILEYFSSINNIENKWGRFDISLSGSNWLFRVIESCMNSRSSFTGIVTGDQVMFIGTELFIRVGGYPEIALMEDIAISTSLVNFSKPIRIREKVISSSRRWEKHGIFKTIIKMWLLRLLYFFHWDTNKLAKLYE